MKKVISLILALIFILSFVGCRVKDNEQNSYFVAKIIEPFGEAILLEVTDSGNSGIQVGNQISISTERVDKGLGHHIGISSFNHIRIEFDGVVMETAPLQIGEIFKVDMTDEDGTLYKVHPKD